MKLQQLYSYTRKAVDAYNMIQDGDKIAIGVSAGKDSLTLLYALKGLQRFYPKKFDLMAITVDLGFNDFDLSGVIDLCKQLDIPYEIIHTEIGQIVFHDRQEKNPCSLCAKMRKGALNEAAKRFGCNKIALGHHKEDIVETMMLSLFFEGRFYAFPPVTHLERMDLYAIRPLMYVPEKDVIGFKNAYKLPVVSSPCPANGHTKREDMKILLKSLNKDFTDLTEHMFRAVEDGLYQKPETPDLTKED